MLPDVDSDSGLAQRELMTFLAAGAPMILLDRFTQAGLSHEQIMLAGGCVYILVRFGLGALLRRYTVHRGMWHSIPAALTAGLVTALLCSADPSLAVRIFKVGAVILGYLIHLLLDELWAIDWHHGRLRFKNSFGTAFKLFSRSWWGNISAYGKLLITATLVYNDSTIHQYLAPPSPPGMVSPFNGVAAPDPHALRRQHVDETHYR